MKTLIITIVVLLLNISGLFGQTQQNNKNIKMDTEMQEYRVIRFSTKPLYGYREDTDRYIMGTISIQIKKEESRESKIINYKNKIKEQPKFKSTYLDFTIIQEENIS